MELRNQTSATTVLVCECGGTTFRLEFRKSEAILAYEEAGATGHEPDMQVAVCTICTAEITMVDTEGKMPMTRMTDEVVHWLMVQAAQEQMHEPYRWSGAATGRHHRTYASRAEEDLRRYRVVREQGGLYEEQNLFDAAREAAERANAANTVRDWFEVRNEPPRHDQGRSPEDDWG